MRHPLPLLYRLINCRGNVERKKWGSDAHLKFSSLNRVVRARLLTFCPFGRKSTFPFAAELG